MLVSQSNVNDFALHIVSVCKEEVNWICNYYLNRPLLILQPLELHDKAVRKPSTDPELTDRNNTLIGRP